VHLARAILAAAVAVTICSAGDGDVAASSRAAHRLRPSPPQWSTTGYKVTEIARGLDHPWSMAFLPDAAILGDRTGRPVASDQRRRVAGSADRRCPGGAYRKQAGLFDIVLHSEFRAESSRLSDLRVGNESGQWHAGRARSLRRPRTSRFARDFYGNAVKDTDNHYGGRMAFLPDGTFALTIGEGFEYREKAQTSLPTWQDRALE